MDILDLLNIINLVKATEDLFPMLLLCIKMAKPQCLGPKCLNCPENQPFEQLMCEKMTRFTFFLFQIRFDCIDGAYIQAASWDSAIYEIKTNWA